MGHLFYLSEVYGPRVTDSPNHRAAAEWIVKRLESYGLQNVHLELWGPFGNSCQYKKFTALSLSQTMPLHRLSAGMDSVDSRRDYRRRYLRSSARSGRPREV
jgi:hypothetical protein